MEPMTSVRVPGLCLARTLQSILFHLLSMFRWRTQLKARLVHYPIATIPASTEVNELAPTRGVCFVEGHVHLGMAAVAVLQCVFKVSVLGASFFLCFFILTYVQLYIY